MIWPGGHMGLEALTSLEQSQQVISRVKCRRFIRAASGAVCRRARGSVGGRRAVDDAARC